jgi:hypothetical protein
MNGFSIGTIFRDNCNTLVIVSGSTVFDLGKLLAASGTDSLPSGFGLSEMLDDWATWFPRIKQAVESGESQGSGDIDTYRIADVSEVTGRAPSLKPRKLICMGTNYAGHATEVSSDPLKAPYSLIKQQHAARIGCHSYVAGCCQHERLGDRARCRHREGCPASGVREIQQRSRSDSVSQTERERGHRNRDSHLE